MEMERDFHMAKGEGDTSYVRNSRLQRQALLKTKPVLAKAVRDVYMDLLQPTMLTVVDLGCSSGENTLLFVSNVIEAICGHCDNLVELQFFLNDLPGNDFNQVFQSLQRFKESIEGNPNMGEETRPPFLHRRLAQLLLHQAFTSPECSSVSLVILPPLALSASGRNSGEQRNVCKQREYLHSEDDATARSETIPGAISEGPVVVPQAAI